MLFIPLSVEGRGSFYVLTMSDEGRLSAPIWFKNRVFSRFGNYPDFFRLFSRFGNFFDFLRLFSKTGNKLLSFDDERAGLLRPRAFIFLSSGSFLSFGLPQSLCSLYRVPDNRRCRLDKDDDYEHETLEGVLDVDGKRGDGDDDEVDGRV